LGVFVEQGGPRRINRQGLGSGYGGLHVITANNGVVDICCVSVFGFFYEWLIPQWIKSGP
jgi:hypothetical protein